jgi:hypothetical protein
MVPANFVLLLTAVAVLQGGPMSPTLTPRKALPVRHGPITFVDPGSPCPPHKGQPVRLGSAIVNPPLLDYTPPRQASAGRVIVEATIQGDGTVRSARALEGPKELRAFAIEAVRQWKFARTCLNGQAIPIIVAAVVTFAAK